WALSLMVSSPGRSGVLMDEPGPPFSYRRDFSRSFGGILWSPPAPVRPPDTLSIAPSATRSPTRRPAFRIMPLPRLASEPPTALPTVPPMAAPAPAQAIMPFIDIGFGALRTFLKIHPNPTTAAIGERASQIIVATGLAENTPPIEAVIRVSKATVVNSISDPEVNKSTPTTFDK